MEQIELEQIKLLARKAQLKDELEAVERSLANLVAFRAGFEAGQPKADPAPTEE